MKAPLSTDWPLETGTRIDLDADVRLAGERLALGGSPWRALRLSSSARAVLDRWAREGVVGPGEGRFARTLVDQGVVHPRHAPNWDVDELTVVVPVRASAAELSGLLDDLAGLRVIVVDDESDDPVGIERACARVGATVIRRDSCGGPAAARNTGLSASETPVVAFIDADVRLSDARGVFARLLGHLRDPRVGAVAPRVRGASSASALGRFERRFSPLDLGRASALVRPRARVSYVPSAFLVARRDALEEGFDEDLRVGEDVDLVWRLDENGWLVRYDADVVVEHATRSSLREWCIQRLDYGSSAAALAHRHPEAMAPLRADVWTIAAWGSLLAGRPRLAGQVTTAIARRAHDRADEVDPGAARELVRLTTIEAGGPIARALTRSYGPALLALAALPVARRRALALYGVGTLWRWRHEQLRPTDVVIGAADDLFYSLGLARGALRERTIAHLVPDVALSTLSWRHLVGRPMLGPGSYPS